LFRYNGGWQVSEKQGGFQMTVKEANDFVSAKTGGEVKVIQDGAGVFLVRTGFGVRVGLHPELDLNPESLTEHLAGWKANWPIASK
jgi:hypothetical protein